MNERIESLSKAEELWIRAQLANAEKLVEAFSPSDVAQPLTLSALDRAFAAWLDSNASADVALANQIINYVGVAFGHKLVEGLGLNWVIATDEHGAEVAVYGLPGRGDVLIYPTNFVAKRWERRETGFLEESYRRIARDIERLKQAHDQSKE